MPIVLLYFFGKTSTYCVTHGLNKSSMDSKYIFRFDTRRLDRCFDIVIDILISVAQVFNLLID